LTKSTPAIRLLGVEPDLGQFLSDEDRGAAASVLVPLVQIQNGPVDTSNLLRDRGAFGALLLDGMLMMQVRVGDQPTMTLLGPSDVLTVTSTPRSMLLEQSSCTATMPTRLAVLGTEVLAAVQRWPALAAGLYVRVAEQADRVTTQLAICQLPRVEARILALLWLLAESWGHVGPAGTVLPVSLRHDALGALIGARRSTVTLALGELSERGAIIRQDGGWLLLESPPVPVGGDHPAVESPALHADPVSSWADVDAVVEEARWDQLIQTVAALREQHIRDRALVAEHLAAMTTTRERCLQTRRTIADRRSNGRQVSRRVPSSG
jgi:CRP-like cAMP-binding protein